MYYNLKTDSQINWTDFWNISDSLVNTISNSLQCSSEYFLKTWEKRCSENNARIKGYHCTRHSNKEVFYKNGILPLSQETVEIDQDQTRSEASDIWNHRSTVGAGPYLCLSYKSAKAPNNQYFKGPEILLGVDGHQPNNDPQRSSPLIVHCEIPISILSDKNYYIFCALKAFLNFLDPEDESVNHFDGASIDLKGRSLDPEYIVKIEEVKIPL